MKIIRVNASQKYDVLVGKDLLDNAGSICAERIGARRGVIITDSNVDALYSDRLIASLSIAGFKIDKFVFEAGEKSKNSKTLIDILEFMASMHLTRSDCVFALGGGVVGDVAGFSSAIYLRGIKFIQIPTTLLAATDSSVGGKTGVDLVAGKNLIGAFHQPSLVICDYSLLDTLSAKIFADGCAEVVKYGVINSRNIFDTTAKGIKENIEDIIAACVEDKRDIVEADEFDTGKRQLLNFGHTVGHAIEKCSNYSISHGEAVAIGMAVITRAAKVYGFCSSDTLCELISLLEKLCLPTKCDFSASEITEAALSDKKRQGDIITLVIPYSIGDCRLHKISVNELENFIAKGI